MQQKPHYQSDHTPETLEGIVSLQRFAKGSLHEREAPIITGTFGIARILIPTENPLEQPHLKSLVGATITVNGIWKRGALHCNKGDITIVAHETPAEEKETDSTPPKESSEESAVPLSDTTAAPSETSPESTAQTLNPPGLTSELEKNTPESDSQLSTPTAEENPKAENSSDMTPVSTTSDGSSS